MVSEERVMLCEHTDLREPDFCEKGSVGEMQQMGVGTLDASRELCGELEGKDSR